MLPCVIAILECNVVIFLLISFSQEATALQRAFHRLPFFIFLQANQISTSLIIGKIGLYAILLLSWLQLLLKDNNNNYYYYYSLLLLLILFLLLLF